MDLKHLKTFQMVATQMSVTRAAIALDYAQSTVTSHIQLLEQDLGKPLFNRLSKGIELTDSGIKLLQYTNRLLELANETRLAISANHVHEGTIRFAAAETIITYRLPHILKQFQETMPDVRLIFRPMPYADLYRSIKNAEVDVAFMLEEAIQPNGLAVRALSIEPIVLIAAPEHRLSMKTNITIHDLSPETLLLTELGCGYRGMFERYLLSAGIVPSNYMEFDSIEAIKQCVMANVGIAVLPKVVVAEDIRNERLVALNWDFQDFTVQTQMLWHPNVANASAISAFIACCEAVLS